MLLVSTKEKKHLTVKIIINIYDINLIILDSLIYYKFLAFLKTLIETNNTETQKALIDFFLIRGNI